MIIQEIQDGVCCSSYDSEGQAEEDVEGGLQGSSKQKQGIFHTIYFYDHNLSSINDEFIAEAQMQLISTPKYDKINCY